MGSFAEARDVIGALRQRVKPLLPRRHAGQLVVVAHSAQFDPEALDLEFGFAFDLEVQIRLPADCGLALGELPAVERMTVCVRTGLPDEAHVATARIGAFLAQRGNALAGPSREAFLHLPEQERMQESVVEMQFPSE